MKLIASLSPALRNVVIEPGVHLLTKADYRKIIGKIPRGDRGGLTVAEAVDSVYFLRGKLTDVRIARKKLETPVPTIRELVAEITRGRVICAAKSVMRYGASAGTAWSVHFGEPGYVSTTENDWDYYPKSVRYPAKRDCHDIIVPSAWRARVARIGDGSGVLDGCLILDARLEVGEPGGRAIWRVVLARPGRGYSAVVEHKFVSAWPYEVATIHPTLHRALKEDVPALLTERRVAEAERKATAAIPNEDMDALTAM